MIYTEDLFENQDKDFDWWTEFWFFNISVACTKDSNLNDKYRYSKEELLKLIDDKKIIILDFSVGSKTSLKPEIQREAFLSKKFLEEKLFSFINTNFIFDFVSFLKKIVNSEKLEKDLEELKNNTQDKLIQIKERAEHESLRYMSLMDMSNKTIKLCEKASVLKKELN